MTTTPNTQQPATLNERQQAMREEAIKHNAGRKPAFGDLMRNPWAGESNPQRDAYFVRSLHVTGKFNPGLWYEMTDKRGKFWSANGDTMMFLDAQRPSTESGGAARNLHASEILTACKDVEPSLPGEHPDVYVLAIARKVEDAVRSMIGTYQPAPVSTEKGEIASLRADMERLKRLAFTLGQCIHNQVVADQAAWIEWQHGEGAEKAMVWIHNGLAGPGHIPKHEGQSAQQYFDANVDERMEPTEAAAPASVEAHADAKMGSSLNRILIGARSQGAHTGMSWGEVEKICVEALAGRGEAHADAVTRESALQGLSYLDQSNSHGRYHDAVAMLEEAQPTAPLPDPLDTPLPCDIKIGHGTIGKGCKLRTLVARMQVLYDMARASTPSPDPAFLKAMADIRGGAPLPDQAAGELTGAVCKQILDRCASAVDDWAERAAEDPTDEEIASKLLHSLLSEVRATVPVAAGWQSIETAPLVKGKAFFCELAWGPQDDQSTGYGFRWEGRWFAAGLFYALGQSPCFEYRQIEVKPTLWRKAADAPPTDSQKGGA